MASLYSNVCNMRNYYCITSCFFELARDIDKQMLSSCWENNSLFTSKISIASDIMAFKRKGLKAAICIHVSMNFIFTFSFNYATINTIYYPYQQWKKKIKLHDTRRKWTFHPCNLLITTQKNTHKKQITSPHTCKLGFEEQYIFLYTFNNNNY